METKRRTLLGIILVLVGLVLLLDNLRVIPGLPDYIFHWANIFLVIALINLFSGNRKPAFIFLILWAPLPLLIFRKISLGSIQSENKPLQILVLIMTLPAPVTS